MNGNTIGFHPQIQNLELRTTYIVSCQSTAEEVSFKQPHHRISSTDSTASVTRTVLIRLNAAMLIKFLFALFKDLSLKLSYRDTQ